MTKYYIVLFRNFLKGFKVANYCKKYEGYNWIAYFNTPEFIIKKLEY